MMRLRPAWGHGMQLAVHSLPIPDVKIISGLRFQDARGYFRETFSRDDLAAQGLASDFIQDNESYSLRAGTVRGLHFIGNLLLRPSWSVSFKVEFWMLSWTFGRRLPLLASTSRLN